MFVIQTTSSQRGEKTFVSLTVADNEYTCTKAFYKGQYVACYRGILTQLLQHRTNGERAFAAIESYPFLQMTVVPLLTV